MKIKMKNACDISIENFFFSVFYPLIYSKTTSPVFPYLVWISLASLKKCLLIILFEKTMNYSKSLRLIKQVGVLFDSAFTTFSSFLIVSHSWRFSAPL